MGGVALALRGEVEAVVRRRQRVDGVVVEPEGGVVGWGVGGLGVGGWGLVERGEGVRITYRAITTSYHATSLG